MAKLVKAAKKSGLFSKVLTKLTSKNSGAELPVNDEPYPIITNEMILPVDQEIRLKDAVKMYKQHMVNIGFLERSELDDFVRSFKEECIEHEQQLRDETNWAKDTLAEAKAAAKPESKKIKKQMARSQDEDEKDDLLQELAEVEEEAQGAKEEYERLAAEWTLFKRDKRAFLVNYINSEVHGQDWREI